MGKTGELEEVKKDNLSSWQNLEFKMEAMEWKMQMDPLAITVAPIPGPRNRTTELGPGQTTVEGRE